MKGHRVLPPDLPPAAGEASELRPAEMMPLGIVGGLERLDRCGEGRRPCRSGDGRAVRPSLKTIPWLTGLAAGFQLPAGRCHLSLGTDT